MPGVCVALCICAGSGARFPFIRAPSRFVFIFLILFPLYLFYFRTHRRFFPRKPVEMSDSEAVVEKRRGRPAKDKSEDSVKEPKKRAREVEKKDKDVVKKDEDVPAKRGRGRPPKSGASAGKKADKPKSKTGKRGRPKKNDKKEKEESAEEEDSKEENEEEDDE